MQSNTHWRVAATVGVLIATACGHGATTPGSAGDAGSPPSGTGGDRSGDVDFVGDAHADARAADGAPTTDGAAAGDAESGGDVAPDSGDTTPGGDGQGAGSDPGGGSDTDTFVSNCPVTGNGAILPSGSCLVFTPAQSGASSSGVNATVNNYALEPTGAGKAGLVVHFNASLSAPWRQIADPEKNFYNAAVAAGFHVLALSYRSNLVVGSACSTDAECYGPTRETILRGVYQTNAVASLNNIVEDEGALWRLDAAIRYMVAAHPAGGWGQFLADAQAATPAARIAWSKIIATGHSQGGGHAAFLGKLFPLRRVVQLSSTCDAVGSTPAPWTSATNGVWATSPAVSYVGFAAPTTFSGTGTPTGGDTICPYHVAVWQAMQLAPSCEHDDAATCGVTAQTHNASIDCIDNYDTWVTLFE